MRIMIDDDKVSENPFADDEPTFDSIPIEWIENWLTNKLESEYTGSYELKMLTSGLHYWRIMIEDWRKEHDQF